MDFYCFDTNYINFRNAGIFKNTILKEHFFVKENEEYFEIMKSIEFFEMESSKLSSSPANMCESCPRPIL